MPEWTHKSWKLKIQFWWTPSTILKYIEDIKNSIDILHFNAKIFCVQKYLRSFQETWNFSNFHSSRTAYTTRLVRNSHNTISSLISASKKETMKFSTNTWNKYCLGARTIASGTTYVFNHSQSKWRLQVINSSYQNQREVLNNHSTTSSLNLLPGSNTW